MSVAKASGSPVYMHLMGVLSGILEDMFAYHRYRLQIGPQYDRLLLAQHRAISDTIQARDGEAAARAMADHLDTVLSSYAEDQDPEPDFSKDKLRVVSG
jgi:DNA-binding FadR family transcriptional regulator